MPAVPKPKFIMPLADPEYLGAMSVGTAQIGPTMSSMEKKSKRQRERRDVDVVNQHHRNQEQKAASIPITMMLRRAAARSPVRCKMRSLMMPPTLSPITPPRKTPAE